MWEDNSPVDFTNWFNEKQIINDEENCASVTPKSLNWTNNECMSLSDRYNYVCQINKIFNKQIKSTTTIYSNTTQISNKTIDSTKTPGLISKKVFELELTKGAKVGFIILSFVIFVSLTINVYFLSKKYNFKLFKQKSNSRTYSNNNRTTSRSRSNDILNSQDPKVVFSNIKLK